MSVTLMLIGLLMMVGGGVFLYMKSKQKDEENTVASVRRTGSMSRNIYDEQMLAMADAQTQMEHLLSANPNLSGNIQVLLDYYQPHRGVITSWLRRSQSDARLKLQQSLNQEQKAYLESVVTLGKQVIEGKKTEIELRLYIAQNATALVELKNRAALADAALDVGMNIEDYSGVNADAARSKIRVQEYSDKIEVDKTHEAWRIDQNLTAAQRYKRVEDEELNRMREELEEAYLDLDFTEERDDISNRTREGLIKSKQSRISNLEFRIAAKEKRLQEDAR